MLPYERFENEADFRDAFVKPLLNRLGFSSVSEHHRTKDSGRDFVFSEQHRLGGIRHYAAQVKHERVINQGKSLDDLVTQVRHAFAKPFKRTDSPEDCHVSAVFIFNSGEIAVDAKEQLLSDLGQARYGDNVHFLDGERLDALDKWGTLQSDTNARARLLGLRSALHVIIFDLSEYRIQGKDTLAPVFVHGLESYLAEPANSDTELIQLLFRLWSLLEGIEELRRMAPIGSELAKAQVPHIQELAQHALPLSKQILEAVDATIETMNPFS